MQLQAVPMLLPLYVQGRKRKMAGGTACVLCGRAGAGQASFCLIAEAAAGTCSQTAAVRCVEQGGDPLLLSFLLRRFPIHLGNTLAA